MTTPAGTVDPVLLVLPATLALPTVERPANRPERLALGQPADLLREKHIDA